jgi:hypothetical protein
MHDYIIEAMVVALKPTLKNRAKAMHILDRFWSDKMALVWDVRDVHTAANEREVALTSKEAMKVLQKMHHYHDKQLGLRWKDVTCYIEEYALGRKLTKAELKRFVENNVLTIERKDRKRQRK